MWPFSRKKTAVQELLDLNGEEDYGFAEEPAGLKEPGYRDAARVDSAFMPSYRITKIQAPPNDSTYRFRYNLEHWDGVTWEVLEWHFSFKLIHKEYLRLISPPEPTMPPITVWDNVNGKLVDEP